MSTTATEAGSTSENLDFEGVSDRDLLAGGLEDQVAINAIAARRLARLEEFRCRQERDYEARRAEDPRFTLTPIQETVLEAGELWGMSEHQVRADLRTTRTLQQHLEGVWRLCLAGALDPYKASLIAETAKFGLERPTDYARFARRITGWLERSIPGPDDPEVIETPARAGLVNRTVKQLRNKLNYEMNKLKPKDANERFKQAYANRRVRASMFEDGIGSLGVTGTTPDIQLADYRLTLAAQALRAGGDERTIEQLRADLALDLLIGRAKINASIPELEETVESSTTEGVDPSEVVQVLPTANYARPVVNVTVPIQTLMGISDTPGVLSGGDIVPATLARQLAGEPESTWYRLLTDEHGHGVELSTESYRATRPIWSSMVAHQPTCFRRNCDRPSTTAEADHKRKWPFGKTSRTNLHPACKSDHKGKHSRGFRLRSKADGTVSYRTRAGFTHTTELVVQPVAHWPEEALLGHEFTATELLDAVRYLRHQDEIIQRQLAVEVDEDEQWILDHAS